MPYENANVSTHDVLKMGTFVTLPPIITGEGTKNDEGKLRYDLIPAEPLEELAKVYTIGSKKYGDWNWAKGIKWSRIIGAMLRHLYAWIRGRSVDPDDSQHPLASVAWCAFTLMWYEKYRKEYDDRFKEE